MNKSKSFRQVGSAAPKNGWKEHSKPILTPEESGRFEVKRVSDILTADSAVPTMDSALLTVNAVATPVQPPTERRLFARKMDATAPQDIQTLRELLSPEYTTLASNKDKLLNSPEVMNQFFLIHGDQMEVHPDLDSALLQGYTRYPADLFFVGQISEEEIHACLST